jgi:hypothetical protein
MKKSNQKFFIAAFKSLCVVLLLGLVFVLAAAWKTNKLADDLWKQLGITHEDGKSYMFNSLQSGYLGYYVKNAKAIAQNDRLAIINDLATQAKKYVASDEFKRRYENNRNLRKPREPQLTKTSAEEIRAREKAIIEQQIKQTEANANHPNPKIRNGVPAGLEKLKKELKALDDPNNPRVQTKLKQEQDMNDAYLAHYNKELQKLDEDFPPNPQVQIKRRLQQILDLTADVDFKAELKEVGKFKVFVNPDYEKKSKDWKLAFRAGKEATDLVRSIATKWLKEIK